MNLSIVRKALSPLIAIALFAAETTGQPATSQPAAPTVEGIAVNSFGGGVEDARIILESLDGAVLGETQTGPTGEFALELGQPLKTRCRLRIEKEGFKPHAQEVEPSEDDPGEPPYVDVVMAGANALHGTVRAKDTGKPIAGARVRCSNGGVDADTKTDAAGEYAFGSLIEGTAGVLVRVEGYAISRQRVEIAGDDNRADFELARQRPVEITVTTPDGRPAEGVLVEAIIEPMQNLTMAMSDAKGRAVLDGVGTDAERIRLRLSGEEYVRTSKFSEVIELVPPKGKTPSSSPASRTAASRPGTVPISEKPAEREGTVPISEKPAERDFRRWGLSPSQPIRKHVVINLGATVRGKVVDEGSGDPIIGVRVLAGRELARGLPMVWTGMEGTYELGGLPTGATVISYQHGEHAPLVREARVAAGQVSTVDVRMQGGQPLAGVVVDSSDKPLPQVWISVESWNGYKSIGMRTITDEQGRFEFPHAPAGDLAFTFVCPGFEPRQHEKLTAGKSDYRIRLSPATAPAGGAPEMADKLKVGQEVPDFALTASDGTKYQVSSLRGKYVFLDCWASWCGPCMAEVPNVKALRAATKTRADFVLLGISLDHDEAAFKKAVEGQSMDWPQAFGPESGAAEAFELLDGFAIPYTCLIGPDGKLIAQRLRGRELTTQVDALLKK